MTEFLNSAISQIDTLQESIHKFRTLFQAFEPGYIEMVDEQSLSAIGQMTRRSDYEIYELEIQKDFCTIHHAHKLAYELHLIIKGMVNIKQDGIDNILIAGQSMTTAKGILHTFIALEDTKIVTIAVPTLNEQNGD
jgi:quercetin dioxygenase-like cupin family protein